MTQERKDGEMNQ